MKNKTPNYRNKTIIKIAGRDKIDIPNTQIHSGTYF